MAIIRPSQYPGRWNPVSADAPQGSGKNRTAPGSNDGSYFDQVWFDDSDSLNQALFIASGISPNGTQDIGTASQIFDALINKRWSSIGNYSPGTIVVGSDGNEYKAVSQNGRDSTVLDPTSATDRTVWVKYPYESGSNANGNYILYHDGLIEMWGNATTGPTGIESFVFPIPFTDLDYHVGPGHVFSPSGSIEYVQVTGKSLLTEFSAVGYTDILTETIGALNFSWYARGK